MSDSPTEEEQYQRGLELQAALPVPSDHPRSKRVLHVADRIVAAVTPVLHPVSAALAAIGWGGRLTERRRATRGTRTYHPSKAPGGHS